MCLCESWMKRELCYYLLMFLMFSRVSNLPSCRKKNTLHTYQHILVFGIGRVKLRLLNPNDSHLLTPISKEAVQVR